MSLLSACPSGCDLSVTSTIVVSDPVAKVASVESLDVTGKGSVAAGKSSMSFFNYGPGVIQVNENPLSVRAALSLPFLGDNKTYGAITYDATGSTLRIDTTLLP